MNIVVLDGYTLNPGDLSWDELESIGSCQIHDRISPTEVVARASNAEIILTNKTVLTREHIAQLPKLKYIGVLATGTNVVDLTAARDRGIPVTNVPAYGTDAVAQHTLALLLALARRVPHGQASLKAGRWERKKFVGTPERVVNLRKIQNYHTGVFAKFVKRLHEMHEGNGNVLDNSIILFGSNMANSDAHNNDPLPQALIGRGGGVKGNQHLHYPQDTPHANILVTMLSKAGVPAEDIEKFADNTGILSDV